MGNIKGGALARKLASAKRWGLIRGSGMLELTPLGKKVVIFMNEEDLSKSRKEAFLTVPLFAELYTRFGDKLPAEQAFIAILAREYELRERDAKTMLTIYKEAVKSYLDAKVETIRTTAPKGDSSGFEEDLENGFPNPQLKKKGAVSIIINSPFGENSFKADSKAELKIVEGKIGKLFALIEDDLPENHNPSGLSNNSNANSNSS